MRIGRSRQPLPSELAAEALANIGRMQAEAGQQRNLLMPKPYTWAEFQREWDIACTDAFEADRASAYRMTVALPHQLFPTVVKIQNQATGQWVKIRRYSWSAFGQAKP